MRKILFFVCAMLTWLHTDVTAKHSAKLAKIRHLLVTLCTYLIEFMRKASFILAAAMLMVSAAVMAQQASKVYLTREISPESLVKIYKALGVEAKGRVAVKMSTGEGIGLALIMAGVIVINLFSKMEVH